MKNSKKITSKNVLAVLLAFFCGSFTFLVAQESANRENQDNELRELSAIVRIMQQINALPIEFKPTTAEILPKSLPNLQLQAALLKQLPAGTKVEIGAHSSGYQDIFLGGGILALHPTTERAATVRRELLRLGVGKTTLTAKGYGIAKIIDASQPDGGSAKNTRLEFLIEKMPDNAANASANQTQQYTSSSNTIIAGKGWRQIVIGASQTQVENALGKPEKFYAGNMIMPNPSAHYFSHGIIVVYDAETNLVKSIDFVGNPAYLDMGLYAGTFRGAAAKPDKNIAWSAPAARILAAYGEPKHKSVKERKGAEVVTLTYDQITFTLNADKVYYVVVTADNNRFLAAMKKEAEEKPARETYAAQLAAAAKPLAYKSEYIVIPGRGMDKAFLGASRSAVEAAFGQPDEFVDEDVELFRIYEANYYSKGFNVEYDPQTKIATAISFYGDTAKTKSFGKFKLFPGVTDKGIRWGMSPADVIKAYGKPVEERMRYNPKLDKDYEFITYPNVAFGFTENRLVYIANKRIWGNK